MILGLDLSLTATGWCFVASSGEITMGTIAAPGVDIARLRAIRQAILPMASQARMIVIEGIAFSRNNPSAQERAALHFMVRDDISRIDVQSPLVAGAAPDYRRLERVYLVAPTALKKFVAGKGNVEKSMMLREVFRRWEILAGNDNEADAVGLAMIGRCLAEIDTPHTKPQQEVIQALLSPLARKAKKRKKYEDGE